MTIKSAPYRGKWDNPMMEWQPIEGKQMSPVEELARKFAAAFEIGIDPEAKVSVKGELPKSWFGRTIIPRDTDLMTLWQSYVPMAQIALEYFEANDKK